MPKDSSLASNNSNNILPIGNSNDIFLLLGNYLFSEKLIDCTPIFFASARQEAESAAWDKSNVKNIDLFQIYKELAFILHLKTEEYTVIMGLELQLTWMLLQNISTRLNLHNGSKEIQSTGKSGNILKTFKIKFVDQPDDILHFQLNETSTSLLKSFLSNDYRINLNRSGEYSFKEVKIYDIQTSRYEKILNENVWETGGLSAVMAGASKLERIIALQTEAGPRNQIEIATGVIAPILVSYTLWILKRAVERQIQTLYYFSNNGSQIFNIAKILIKKLDLNIKVKLLPFSENEVSLNKEKLQNFFQEQNIEINNLSAIVGVCDEGQYEEINRYVEEFEIKNLYGFYFSLQQPTSNFSKIEGYMWDVNRNLGFKNLLTNTALIKILFISSEIATDKYHSSDMKENTLAGIIQNYTENIFLTEPFVDAYTDMRVPVAAIIKTILRNPSPSEALFFNLMYENSSLSAKNKKMAESYKMRDLFQIFKNTKTNGSADRWKEGSLSLTPRLLGKLIIVGEKIGRRIKAFTKK